MAAIYSDIMSTLTTLGGPLVEPYYASPYWNQRKAAAVVTLDGTQSNGDVMRFIPVESDWAITMVRISCDAIAGATSVDVGIHNADGGAAASVDLFASAFSITSAQLMVQKRYPTGGNLALTTVNQPIWELIGLARDPRLKYEVSMNMNVAGTGSGNVMVEIEYGSNE